jgi:GGDEF domain-containing protein
MAHPSPERVPGRFARAAALVSAAGAAAAAGGYGAYALTAENPRAAGFVASLASLSVLSTFVLHRLGRGARATAAAPAPAVIDASSGLGNRLYFGETVWREINRSRRYGSIAALAVFEVGVVNFKPATAEDRPEPFAAPVAEVLTEIARESDICFRLDARLFATLLPECELEGARRFVERVGHAVSLEPYARNGDGSAVYIRAWGGCAEWAPEIEDPQQFLEAALADLAKLKPGFDAEQEQYRGGGPPAGNLRRVS